MINYIWVVYYAFKNSSVYKIKLIFYSLTGIVQFFVYFSLWSALYKSDTSYMGFDLNSIQMYFILAFIIQSILPKWIAMEISWSVKKGDILYNLLRPFDYKTYYFLYSFGDVFFTFLFMGIPIVVLGVLYNSFLYCQNILGFIVALIFSYIIAFNIFYILGLFSFWLKNIWGIFNTFNFIYLFFSGAFIPIDLMPSWLKKIIDFLPFKYIIDFPISIWLNYNNDIKYYFIQIFWVVFLSVISHFIYKKALKQIEIFGG